MHSDHKNYLKFSGRQRLEKAVNSLLGIVEGISADSKINSREVAFLDAWLEDHRELARSHPYNELMPVVSDALADGFIADDEKQDIVWLCGKLRSSQFVDLATADIQRLHAVLGGIAADGLISESELEGLSTWLSGHEHLKTLWPYDEVDSLVTSVLQDRKIDSDEQKILLNFFSTFTAILDDRVIASPPITENYRTVGLCAVCPDIVFNGSTFCLTGASAKYKRSEFADLVLRLGGSVASSVSKKVNYLVIGAEGNPCWMYACYGRKVEKAVELRKQGVPLVIVHEHDFHDAVADA